MANPSYAPPSRIVVAGASLAGLSAAEALRRLGYCGDLVLVGDEPHPPYDRPPLSKQVLTRRLSADTTLPQPRDLGIDWQLGVAAHGVDLSARRLELANGGALDYDRLLIATGTRARPWPKPDEAAVDGVLTLRGRDDAQRLASRLAAAPRRVVIIGSGFIGCELASCCCEMGLAVTIIEGEGVPMRRALGERIGAFMAGVIRDHGVDLRLGAAVERIAADNTGAVAAVVLKDGTRIHSNLVIVALGAVRNVEWLEGSGLLTSARGLRCDAFCRALKGDESPAPGVFAAGDVAHWPLVACDGHLVAVEHWGNAVEQARMAAHNMLAGDITAMRIHQHLPDFWSSQFGLNIKCVGLADRAEEMAIVQGSVEERRFLAVFGRNGRTIAALSVNSARWLPAYRALIEEGAPFPPIQGAVDQPRIRKEAAGFASTGA
jgi:NADPH-dependent 2,4-dienoyl-CoA reductase/sulfur reductase-like enzyme